MLSYFPTTNLEVFLTRFYPGDKGMTKRSPTKPSIINSHALSGHAGRVYGQDAVQPDNENMIRQLQSEQLGERIIVRGHVPDGSGWPVPDTRVTIWQANACGR